MIEIILTILFWFSISIGLGVAWGIYCLAADWKRRLDADPTLTALRRSEDD